MSPNVLWWPNVLAQSGRPGVFLRFFSAALSGGHSRGEQCTIYSCEDHACMSHAGAAATRVQRLRGSVTPTTAAKLVRPEELFAGLRTVQGGAAETLCGKASPSSAVLWKAEMQPHKG